MLLMHMPTVNVYAEDVAVVQEDKTDEDKDKDKDPVKEEAKKEDSSGSSAETNTVPAEAQTTQTETPAKVTETPAEAQTTQSEPPAQTSETPAETPTHESETPAQTTETTTETPASQSDSSAQMTETPSETSTSTSTVSDETNTSSGEMPVSSEEPATNTQGTPSETPESFNQEPSGTEENTETKEDDQAESKTEDSQEETKDSGETKDAQAIFLKGKAATLNIQSAYATTTEENTTDEEPNANSQTEETSATQQQAAGTNDEQVTKVLSATTPTEDSEANNSTTEDTKTGTTATQQQTTNTSGATTEEKTDEALDGDKTEETSEETKAEETKSDNKKEESSNQQTQQNTASNTAPETALIKTASAIVHWKDNDDVNEIRPGFLNVILQKSTDGGATYSDVETYRLSAENDWKVQLEDLAGTEDGKEVTYRWDWEVDDTPEGSLNEVEDSNEHNIVGYLRDDVINLPDGVRSERTYIHETVTRKYTIAINWDDMGDDMATIPDTLDVVLPDGRTVTLKAADGWKLDVEIPIIHRDLEWSLGAAEGWLSNGTSTDYDEDSTIITFNRKWATTTEIEPAGMSTLKVQYWIGSTEAAPMFLGVYENGQTYNVSVPKITGYRAKVTRVKGTINGDTIINVKYVPITYNVTVYYRYLNGQTAAPTAYRSMTTGTSYNIGSPAIGGYVASVSLISGTVTGRDLTYVVYYTGTGDGLNNGAGRESEQMVDVNTFDDYRTPLGLGEIGINAGECFE